MKQQVLAPRERRKLKVAFNVNPPPAHIQGLHHFSVQILTTDGTPVGRTKNIKTWKDKKTSRSVTLDNLYRVEFEEGWHVVRILPWTADGDPIPLATQVEGGEWNGPRPHESAPFYVLLDTEIEEEPPQQGIPHAASLEHARIELQCAAILRGQDPHTICPDVVGWTDKSGTARHGAHELLLARFGHEGTYHIPVPNPLKNLEQCILAAPERPVSWRMHITMGQVGSPTGDILAWPKSAAVESFLAARAQYFDAIRAGTKELISQATDFGTLRDTCAEYAVGYRDLLRDLQRKVEQSAGMDQQRAITALRTALAVDTVRVMLTDFRGQTREAILVGPTHPLRALWLATWSQVAQRWIAALQDAPTEYVSSVRHGLVQRLVPLHVPAMLPLPDSRIFTTVDNLHPFWSL